MPTIQGTVPPSAEVRVQGGFDFLNERLPDWRSFVNPRLLDLDSASWCVLAQLSRHPELRGRGRGSDPYERACDALGLSPQQQRQFGFLAEGLGRSGVRRAAEYNALEEEWVRVIRAQRPLDRIKGKIRRFLHV